jgi:hypothetical protein
VLQGGKTLRGRDLDLDASPDLATEAQPDVEPARLHDTDRGVDDLDGPTFKCQWTPRLGQNRVEVVDELIDVTTDDAVDVFGRPG